MNVYDFDGTILEGDSERYFFAYVKKNHLLPKRYQRKMDFWRSVERRHKTWYEQTRPRIYRALCPLSGKLDGILTAFWDEHEQFIKPYYAKQKKEDDVITSATPRFILEPIMKRIGAKNLIATEIDTRTMKLLGKWNKGKEKITHFRNLHPDAVVEEFYSDSLIDTPMASLAKKAFFVKGEEITPWPEESFGREYGDEYL